MAEPKTGDILINPKTGDAYQIKELLFDAVEMNHYANSDTLYATKIDYKLSRIEIEQL